MLLDSRLDRLSVTFFEGDLPSLAGDPLTVLSVEVVLDLPRFKLPKIFSLSSSNLPALTETGDLSSFESRDAASCFFGVLDGDLTDTLLLRPLLLGEIRLPKTFEGLLAPRRVLVLLPGTGGRSS